MKFIALLTITVAFAVSSVEAIVAGGVNAHRLARGLSPLAPRSLGTRTSLAKRSTPSGAPGQCHTGPVQCCNKTGTKHSDNYIDNLLGLVEAHDVGDDVLVGVECTPVTAVGVGGGGSSCHAETVCCKNNNYKGVVVVGCSPVHL